MYSTGATVISKLLMNNCVIQELQIRGNAIGDEGARVILQSAVTNEACQANIWIDDEYSEVQTLIKIMEDRWRRRMKTNEVGYLVLCMIIVVMVIYNRLLLVLQ